MGIINKINCWFNGHKYLLGLKLLGLYWVSKKYIIKCDRCNKFKEINPAEFI